MASEFIIRSINDYLDIVGQLDARISSHPVVLLKGNLGAGKTTFMKFWCAHHGLPEGEVSSPSFGLMNVYDVAGRPVYHFDLYRVEEGEELEEMGFYEFLDSGNPCFVEWPDNFTDHLPHKGCQWLIFEVNENEGIRIVTHRLDGHYSNQ